jgi:crossover junction endodeoxyribonuclease RusA
MLPVAPSGNRYWRQARGRLYLSSEGKQYRKDVAAICQTAGVKKIPLARDVAVKVNWFRARRAGDLDNRMKVLLDALQGVAFDNDSQVAVLHAFRFEDKAAPRMEVVVVPL